MSLCSLHLPHDPVRLLITAVAVTIDVANAATPLFESSHTLVRVEKYAKWDSYFRFHVSLSTPFSFNGMAGSIGAFQGGGGLANLCSTTTIVRAMFVSRNLSFLPISIVGIFSSV